MIPRVSVVFLASDLAVKGARKLAALDARAAAALHTGGGVSTNPKTWPCEDSLALHRLADGARLAAVADAHWGGAAGETVARELLASWQEAGEGRALQRLHRALLRLEARHLGGRDPQDPSETTALLAHLAGRTLSFVSVGDSFLLVLDPARGTCALKNELAGIFLGQHPLSARPGSPIDGGTLELAPGQLVLLASDGLEQSMCDLAPERCLELLAGEAPLEERLARLLDAAAAPPAGRDNLALVALAVE